MDANVMDVYEGGGQALAEPPWTRRRFRGGCGSVGLIGLVYQLGCGSDPIHAPLPTRDLGLQLDPHYQNSRGVDLEAPANDYTLFETGSARPIAVLAQSGLVAVTNTVDDYLEIFRPGLDGLVPCGAVQVGMRPVAVAAVSEASASAELWVVNHVSDSVSIVRLDTATCVGDVAKTLHVGDEPQDVVATTNSAGEPRVFITTAHRGQHHPREGARTGSDLARAPAEKEQPGLADVFVFDPRAGDSPIAIVNLFTDSPRALAVGEGVVYAAGFYTGNRTTVIPAEVAAQTATNYSRELLATDSAGNYIERDGELVLSDGVAGRMPMKGGMAAVAGQGRCMPDPRPHRSRSDGLFNEVCVATDADGLVERAVLQQAGVVDPTCQCTSGDGSLQPFSSVIVKFFDDEGSCGKSFVQFPDGTRGCWLDADPRNPPTPAAKSERRAAPMAWNDEVHFSLADQDVFAIGVDELAVRDTYTGVGTVLFGMAVDPATGRLFVSNTDAQNLGRYEGRGESASTTVIGHLYESRITLVDPAQREVLPVHLNTHVDYGRCCDRDPVEHERSLAFPTAGVFSQDGSQFYFAALGSDKIGRVSAGSLGGAFDNAVARAEGHLADLELGEDPSEPSGPIGIELDQARNLLYIKTHFSNELLVVDPVQMRVVQRTRMISPEPASISRGRHVLYDAALTSSHGDSACGSCHIFGNFDGLAWDLGNPDEATVPNPGPYTFSPEFGAFPNILFDPFGEVDPVNRPASPDFFSNKGPMTTQTLAGLANHGPQHWRGDRTRRFHDTAGEQPNFGSLDEDNSFNEFDVAITGLNGNDKRLDAAQFQAFTNFALQLSMPPNPIRPLDGSLSPEAEKGRAIYFGCASMTDEQYASRSCVDGSGDVVDVYDETQACRCAVNPFVDTLRYVPDAAELGSALQAVFAAPETSTALAEVVATESGTSADVASALAKVREGAVSMAEVDFSLGTDPLLSRAATDAVAAFTSSLIGLTAVAPDAQAVLEAIATRMPEGTPAADSPLRTASGLAAALQSVQSIANLYRMVLADDAARGSSGFRDLLQGCDYKEPPRCNLRITNGVSTCNGCHTLDPQGNAEFEVYRPGFFGTSGRYSFAGLSQVFKVPQLRSSYQKAGKFGGGAVPPFVIPDSVLGARHGGFFASEPIFSGAQIRGYGFLHDGVVDTLHGFHGLTAFSAQPGNDTGFDAVFPAPERRADCVQSFRDTSVGTLDALDPALRDRLEMCTSSAIPDICFSNLEDGECQSALAAVARARGEPGFGDVFGREILPLCFQLGSMLEGGAEQGNCYPRGLAERAQTEAFLLAFDTNFKPMVGQQITIEPGDHAQELLRLLLASAARGECDAAARQNGRGYLVIEPHADEPGATRLLDSLQTELSLESLPRDAGPITLTCYPPQVQQAEARRAAFARGPG